MAVITNEVSWSRKRKGALEGCPRRYYYQVYLKWDGWQDDAPADRRLAYRLSHMTSLPRIAGIAVHETIRRLIARAGRGQSLSERAEDVAASIMRRIWVDARGRRWQERPKIHPPVFELYYEDGVPREEIVRWGAVARNAVKAFERSETFSRISASDPATWLSVDEPLDADSAATIIEGDIRVWCRPDFAMRDGDRVLVYDWKTGAAKDDDRTQLLSYALHARHAWGFAPEKIVCIAAYLRDHMDEVLIPVSEAGLDVLLGEIRADVARMRALDACKDDPERFPVDPKPAVCAWCEFQEMCPAVRRVPRHRMEHAADGSDAPGSPT